MDLDIVRFTKLVVTAAVPYLLAAQGTMLAGRAGVFIVSQEGVMLVGASVGFLASFLLGGNGVGMLAAMLVGALFGLVFAYFTTTLKMDQFVIGLALFFLGLGLSTLLYKLFVGVTLTPPLIPTLSDVPVPLLHRIPLVGPVLFRQDLVVYGSLLLTAVLYVLLYRTNTGLQLRSVGESPQAADSVGIQVVRTRYVTTIVGAALMAMAGAYLPMVYTGTFTEGIAAGRGWIAIALTFFGGWRPHFILGGAFFFAFVEVFALRAQVRGSGVAPEFLLMTPYVATVLVMMLAARWARTPGFLGRNYDRESRTG
jgi:general nucleoside transport system permease protein